MVGFVGQGGESLITAAVQVVEDTVVAHTLDELLSIFNKYNYNKECCSQKARITNIRKIGGQNDRN
jgi:hypothetical protein